MHDSYEFSITKLEAAIQAVINLITHKVQIDSRDRVGVVVFNHLAQELVSPLPVGTERRRLIEAIQTLHAGGGTDINAGLIAASRMLWAQEHEGVRRVVLVTDGHGGDPLGTATSLKAQDVVIDVVGIGPEPYAVDEPLLKQVASVVDGSLRYQFIKDRHTLVDHFSQLANKTHTH